MSNLQRVAWRPLRTHHRLVVRAEGVLHDTRILRPGIIDADVGVKLGCDHKPAGLVHVNVVDGLGASLGK
jgi:hypothetical protein